MTRKEAIAAIGGAATLLGDEVDYEEEGNVVAKVLDGLDELDAFLRQGGVFDDEPEPTEEAGLVHSGCASGPEATAG